MKRGIIIVDGQQFKTQAHLKTFVREMLDRYDDGESLSIPDLRFCKSLIERHPDAIGKVGVGIKSIKVSITHPWTTKGFILTRVDGSDMDFSYKACISSKGMTQWEKINRAARSSIHDQIISFKRTKIVDELIECSVTGEHLHWRECDIDHYPVAFADLLDRYVKMMGVEPDNIKIVETVGILGFADTRLTESFRKYHLENAKLRPLKSSLNVELGRHRVNL